MLGGISLARANLRHDWRRYFAAVLAVAFTGLLIVAQSALLLGLFSTVSLPVDASRAQVWVGSRNTESVDLGRTLPLSTLDTAWMQPVVTRVERYVLGEGELIRPDGAAVLVQVHAVDSTDGALAFSRVLSAEQRALLAQPGAILVDSADLDKLGARVGGAVEINGKRAWVVGVLRGLRALGGANIITGLPSVPTLLPAYLEQASYGLLQLTPGSNAQAVADAFARATPRPRFDAWSAAELSFNSRVYWLLESGAGIASGVATLLSLLVGVAITSQTLSGAILASLREFAALRALGVPQRALAASVLEQALWVGLAGLVLAAPLCLGLWGVGQALDVALSFPWWMLSGAGLLILLIALASGVLALRPLRATDPATLLR